MQEIWSQLVAVFREMTWVDRIATFTFLFVVALFLYGVASQAVGV